MDNKPSGILIFAEQSDGVIHRVTYELINKAQELAESLSTEIAVAVLSDKKHDLDGFFNYDVDKVFSINSDYFGYPDEVFYKENLVKVVENFNPEIILIGATSFGRSLAPRLAISLETGLTADCVDLQIDPETNKLIQIRPAFSGNILAHIKTVTYPQIATIRYKEFNEAVKGDYIEGEIIELEPIKYNKDINIEKVDSKIEDITEAEVIVAGGKGLKQAQDIELLDELANQINATVGGSRDIVDEGYLPHSNQVGYSGFRVKPKVYIACGISGATQHIVGMKESDVIISINKDPSAPIFNVSNIGIVGDLYEVVPKLIQRIENVTKEK